MLFDRYEQQGLFVNMNFKEATSAGGQAYRGDLVLVEGEVADASGRRKPPTATVRQGVLLSDGEKLQLASGLVDDIAKLETFVARYAADFSADAFLLFFVSNIAVPLQVRLSGARIIALPLYDGMVWNELLDELRLDKGDLKGQSSADKVITVCKAGAGYRPKGDPVSLADALTRTVEVKRGGRGPV